MSPQLVKISSLIALAAVAFIAGCQTPTAPQPVRSVVPADVGGFVQQWEAPLMLGSNDPILKLHLRNDMLYVYTGRNAVYVLSATGGQVIWANHVGNPGDELRPPLLMDKNLTVVPCVSTLSCINERGTVQKSIDIGHSIRSPLAGSGNNIYCGLDYANGGRLAKIDLTKPVNNTVWELMTNKGVSSGPVFYQGILFAAGENGLVYALNESREVIWPLPGGVFKTERPVTADLKADASGLYVASGDSKLYCLDLSTGKIKWQYFASMGLRDGPELTADSVYQPVPGVGVVALDKSTGEFIRKPRWTVETGRRFLAEDEQYVYLQGVDNSIIGVDKKTGEQKFHSTRNDLVAFASNPKGDTIYAATAGGAVLGIKAVTKPGTVGQMVKIDLEFEPVAMVK